LRMAGKTSRPSGLDMRDSVLKLGTRKSLLAWAQSSWVARQIEKHNPGIRVELVGIETRGDRILDVSLQALSETSGGKEFFVAEIDQALRSRLVDLTVHSMKDLSLDRPAEFQTAAIPPRENPRDVALFGPGVIEKLKRGETLTIGTSSPRRLENIPAFLKKALPRFSSPPQIEFREIRGNVNTRLSRVHEPASSPKHLDAVVLAFAGIIRLWKDEKGREELGRLLDGVKWMVLPLKECPAAPAQGALAIECRELDHEVFEKIRKIHCADTEAHVSLERSLLAEWGGGCHQKFGATAISTGSLPKLFFIRGRKPDGDFVDELQWLRPPSPLHKPVAWDGSQWRTEASFAQFAHQGKIAPGCFIAHARALLPDSASILSGSRVWTSGVASWFKLASQGVWVEGCAENLGFKALQTTLSEEVLRLPVFKDWTVLTHAGASGEWAKEGCTVLETYQLTGGAYPEQAVQSLRRSTHVFWSSGSQFDELKHNLSHDAHQACGPGKTSEHIAKVSGVGAVSVFPSAEEWRKWINED
jgi:hydroxymethylbilane synthase